MAADYVRVYHKTNGAGPPAFGARRALCGYRWVRHGSLVGGNATEQLKAVGTTPSAAMGKVKSIANNGMKGETDQKLRSRPPRLEGGVMNIAPLSAHSNFTPRRPVPEPPVTKSVFPAAAHAVIHKSAPSPMTSGRARAQQWNMRFERRRSRQDPSGTSIGRRADFDRGTSARLGTRRSVRKCSAIIDAAR